MIWINWWILTPHTKINMSHYFHSANIEFVHLYDDFKAILIDFDNCLANKTENTHKNYVQTHTHIHTWLRRLSSRSSLLWNHILVYIRQFCFALALSLLLEKHRTRFIDHSQFAIAHLTHLYMFCLQLQHPYDLHSKCSRRKWFNDLLIEMIQKMKSAL